uniref:Tudor domain-containing protein n=1 Tax=Panagrolaimus sp. PS1159 TaxID=55785 RepID=A0AC35F8R1_9BILA
MNKNFKLCVCESKENFMLFVVSFNEQICVSFIHIECESYIKLHEFQLSQQNDQCFESVVNEIKAFSTEKPKAAIFHIFVNPTFKRFCKLRDCLKDYCIFDGIPFKFINTSILTVCSILFGVRLDIKDAKKITILHQAHKCTNAINIIKDGNIYKIKDNILSDSDQGFIDYSKYEESDKIIVAVDNLAERKYYQNLKKNEKTVLLNGSYIDYVYPTLVNMIKNFGDNGENCFKIFPDSVSKCVLSIQQKCEPFFGDFYFNDWDEVTVPYIKSFVANVSMDEKLCVNVLSKDGNEYECLKTYEFPNAGYFRIKLTIDDFYKVDFEPLDKALIPFDFEPLDKALIPCLIHQNNEIVSIVLSDLFIGIQVRTIDSIRDCNGDSFIIPYISFFNEGVVIGKYAVEMKMKHPKFVVYDLFKIIEIIHTGASPDSTWGFSIQKNSEGSSSISQIF